MGSPKVSIGLVLIGLVSLCLVLVTYLLLTQEASPSVRGLFAAAWVIDLGALAYVVIATRRR